MSRISFPRSSGLYNDSGTMRKGFGMTVTLASAAQLLKRHGLLREIIRAERWTLDAHDIEGADTAFSAITYDTRDVREGTLLCCKGRFKAEYLHDIDERGLAAYVADTDFSAETGAPGLIVNDARKAMSLLSAEFYGRPQDELTVVGITGTKGKTTTAYFTQAVLNAHSHGKAALFSSVDNCLDGHTYVESDLTTPESMDAFRMMREAADNGMKHLVMEVSSQAYKVERVYGLTFDVATFLNISPDHIRGLPVLQAPDRAQQPCAGARRGQRSCRPAASGRGGRRRAGHHVRAAGRAEPRRIRCRRCHRKPGERRAQRLPYRRRRR